MGATVCAETDCVVFLATSKLTDCAAVQERSEFDEPDYALIDTLFSLAEAHLFMQARPLVVGPPTCSHFALRMLFR